MKDVILLIYGSSIWLRCLRIRSDNSIAEAFAKTFQELKTFDGFAGAIAIDKDGNIYHQDSHPSMVFASFDGESLEVFN